MDESVDVVPRRSKRIRNNINKQCSNKDESIISKLLNDDILWEILVRLTHAKYAIRCSLVSKQWFSLIHHHQFTAEFSSRRNDTNNFQLFFRIGGSAWPKPMSVHRLYAEKESDSETNRASSNSRGRPQWPDLKLRASSLDLFVFKNKVSNEIHVCNPVTWQWLKIPGPTEPKPSNYTFVGIVTNHGNFGHYKVVIVDDSTLHRPVIQGHIYVLDIHVFCSRTRVWSRSAFSVPHWEFKIYDAVSSQGVLYFPYRDNGEIIGVLVCSPLESSRFRFVECPTEGFLDWWRASPKKVLFGVVSGRLRVSQLLKRKKVFSLKIWELRYDNESEFESEYSWALVHDVSLRSGNSDTTKLYVVAFHPYDGNVIFVVRDCRSICRYNNIGEGDDYTIVARLPISNLNLSIDKKNNINKYVKAFTLLHTSWPTPLDPNHS